MSLKLFQDNACDSILRMFHSCYPKMIRGIALVGFCALLVTLNLKEAEAAVVSQPMKADVVAQKKESVITPATPPAKFRSGTEDYSSRIAGSLGFVLLVALAGFITVRLMKRKGGFVEKDKATKEYGVRLLSFKRVALRLNVLVIDVGQGKVVTLADNGNSLLKLAEFDEGTIRSHETISEKSHEK